MGTGISRSLRLYMLHDWAPEVDVPEKLEKKARELCQRGLRQAEAQPPQHRRGLPISEPRPRWMDPTFLHIALAGPSSVALENVLAALACIAPLAEVFGDDEGDCPIREARESGLRSFAFVDLDLRMLRLWIVLDDKQLCNAALGLSRFDLLLWLQGPVQEEEEVPELDTAAASAARQKLEQAILKARAEKQQYIEDEDYDAAHEAKQREKSLQAELDSLPADTGPSAEELERLEEKLRQARKAKQVCIECEDYDAAFEAKEKEKQVLAELEQLKSQPRGKQGSGSRGAVCPQALQKLASWPEGRPPLVVAGPEGEGLEAMRRTLPEASVWVLPASALQDAAPQASTLLMRTPAFCELLEDSVQMIMSSRSFPEGTKKDEDLGDGLKRGAPVRLTRLNSEAMKPHNGKGGILVDMDRKGYHIRLWDDEVIQVFRNNFTQFKFKLGPPSPCVLTKMDRMIVRLKDLKSKPQLNGQEGTTDADPADNGRHNVQLKDGTIIAAKPANFDVLEPDRPELEECVGMLDGFKIAETAKYKVLIVKPGTYGRIRIEGLQKKPELNGKEGTITSFKMETERYQVLLDNGSQLGVKRGNIEFLEAQRISAKQLTLRADNVDYWLDPDAEEMLFAM